jgi:hypothetical protein
MTELKETAQRWVWDCAFSGDSQYIITGIYKGRPRRSDLNLTLWCHRFYHLAPLPVLDPICLKTIISTSQTI